MKKQNQTKFNENISASLENSSKRNVDNYTVSDIPFLLESLTGPDPAVKTYILQIIASLSFLSHEHKDAIRNAGGIRSLLIQLQTPQELMHLEIIIETLISLADENLANSEAIKDGGGICIFLNLINHPDTTIERQLGLLVDDN